MSENNVQQLEEAERYQILPHAIAMNPLSLLPL